MNFFSRHKNTVALAVVLGLQLLLLAVQIKRQADGGSVRLIRLAAISVISPLERSAIYGGKAVRGVWAGYLDMRGVYRQNQQLQAELAQLHLEQARELEDARMARRLQALLGFKQTWIDTTVAAQVIGTSGSETSRLLYLDKGVRDGLKPDMPVITPNGVVGKVLAVYGETSQVLVINDATSGVGAILPDSRLQGILKGTPDGLLQLNYILGDQTVKVGEPVVTSGGDRIFPKGLPLGTVAKVGVGRNLFLDIRVKPAVSLDRLEEVLVVTVQKPRPVDPNDLGSLRTADLLSSHLPGVPQPVASNTAANGKAANPPTFNGLAPTNQPAAPSAPGRAGEGRRPQ